MRSSARADHQIEIQLLGQSFETELNESVYKIVLALLYTLLLLRRVEFISSTVVWI